MYPKEQSGPLQSCLQCTEQCEESLGLLGKAECSLWVPARTRVRKIRQLSHKNQGCVKNLGNRYKIII